MKKKIIVIASLAVFLLSINMYYGYKPNVPTGNLPKLVVGIVVDQMTYDFIPRYMDKYTDDGFKKMISGGFFCTNANYIHFPTYTAVGHTCIYTGTVPAINGICSNDWVDSGKTFYRYCADDTNYSTVGSKSKDGRMSPSSLMTNTITDQLRISSGLKSRVFGIALKDRGGIFPAGHKGNAVYWFDTKANGWITSSYYMNELPGWVNEFNGRGLPQKYLDTVWNTILPLDKYIESLPDDNDFEDTFKGKERPVFPYNLSELQKKNGNLIRYTPYGNTLTREFAEALLKNEKAGLNGYTDFLCVSFSSSDYTGHKFGPNSVEVEDIYLRMDKELSLFLNFLEGTYGKQNVLVFLTADHGICSNPEYLKTKGIDAGTFFHKAVLDSVNSFLYREYGKEKLAMYFMNQQIFFDRNRILSAGLSIDGVTGKTVSYIRENVSGVTEVYTSAELKSGSAKGEHAQYFKNGFYESRCGEIFVNFKKYWIEDRVKGAEHGSPYEYDTHVPLIWYGWKIGSGETSESISITDIVPTLATLLGIPPPEGCIGKPIKGVTDFIK